MPAVWLNSAAAMCWVAPKPGAAIVNLPGLAFAAAIRSLTVSAGKSDRVTITKPAAAICPIESNAVS